MKALTKLLSENGVQLVVKMQDGKLVWIVSDTEDDQNYIAFVIEDNILTIDDIVEVYLTPVVLAISEHRKISTKTSINQPKRD